MLNDVSIDDDEEIVSFDVKSLYTNVPVVKAIIECTILLYSGRYKKPPVSKSTNLQGTLDCTVCPE